MKLLTNVRFIITFILLALILSAGYLIYLSSQSIRTKQCHEYTQEDYFQGIIRAECSRELELFYRTRTK